MRASTFFALAIAMLYSQAYARAAQQVFRASNHTLSISGILIGQESSISRPYMYGEVHTDGGGGVRALAGSYYSTGWGPGFAFAHAWGTVDITLFVDPINGTPLSEANGGMAVSYVPDGGTLFYPGMLQVNYTPDLSTSRAEFAGAILTGYDSQSSFEFSPGSTAVIPFDLEVSATDPGTIAYTPSNADASIQTYAFGAYPSSGADFTVPNPLPVVVFGDLNCDGSVNFKDINPFVAVLTDPSAWQVAHPGCPLLNGDTNFDGSVNFKDINPFVAVLTRGLQPCP